MARRSFLARDFRAVGYRFQASASHSKVPYSFLGSRVPPNRAERGDAPASPQWKCETCGTWNAERDLECFKCGSPR